MKWLIKSSLIFFIAFSSGMLQAEIYKWVDENGRTHYGEKPPEEGASEVKIKDNTPEPGGELEKHNVDREKLLEIYEEERRQKKEEKLKMEEEQKKKEKYCMQLKNDLKDMQKGGSFYELDENGERKYISDKEIANRIKELQTNYKDHCK